MCTSKNQWTIIKQEQTGENQGNSFSFILRVCKESENETNCSDFRETRLHEAPLKSDKNWAQVS